MILIDRLATASARAPYAESVVVGKSSHVFIEHAIEDDRAICGAAMKYGKVFESSASTVADFLELEGEGSCGRCCRILRKRLAEATSPSIFASVIVILGGLPLHLHP
jgi:hypothetical protein